MSHGGMTAEQAQQLKVMFQGAFGEGGNRMYDVCTRKFTPQRYQIAHPEGDMGDSNLKRRHPVGYVDHPDIPQIFRET